MQRGKPFLRQGECELQAPAQSQGDHEGRPYHDYEWNLEFVARVAATAGEFIRAEQEV